MSPDEQIIRLVEAVSTLAIAWQGKRLIPLIRVHVRMQLDVRRQIRRLVTAQLEGTSTDGTPRAHTPTPAPDELERDAQRALGELDR